MSDLAKKLAIILVVSSTIVGCSKKEEGAASDASVATESAAPNSETIRANAAKNPEQLVSTQQSALEQNRQLIKSAELKFEVNDVLKTTSTLEQQLLHYNGYIENKQIDYQVSDRSQHDRIDGTVDIYEKITPTVQLTVRIPNDQVTTFLNHLLPLMLNFNTQSYEAKRYELKLLEEKLNTANQSNSASNAVNNQLQQLTDLEVKDRLAYSTIRLEFFQQPKVRKSHDLNIHRIASLDSDPLLTRIAEAFKIGLSYFKETLIWLIQFWAFYIVIIAIWLIRKAYKTRKQNP
jgi:exonuclease VII large subunit